MTQQKTRITQQKTRKTPRELQTERNARKQALGVLHRLYSLYIPLAHPFDEQLSREVYDAFHVLAPLIHGEPTGKQWTALCDCCHEAYREYWVVQQKEGDSFPLHQDCCTSCKDRLLQEGRLLKIDGKPVVVASHEVQA